MANITTFSAYSNTVDSLQKRTTFSSVTTLTGESNHSKPYAYCSHTRSNTPKTSSSFEAITNVHPSIESMDSTTNVSFAVHHRGAGD